MQGSGVSCRRDPQRYVRQSKRKSVLSSPSMVRIIGLLFAAEPGGRGTQSRGLKAPAGMLYVEIEKLDPHKMARISLGTVVSLKFPPPERPPWNYPCRYKLELVTLADICLPGDSYPATVWDPPERSKQEVQIGSQITSKCKVNR